MRLVVSSDKDHGSINSVISARWDSSSHSSPFAANAHVGRVSRWWSSIQIAIRWWEKYAIV